MSQGQANDWIQRLTPILQAALKEEALLPERDPAALERVLSDYDLLEFTYKSRWILWITRGKAL